MFKYIHFLLFSLLIKIIYGQNSVNYQGYRLRCPTNTNFLFGNGNNVWPATRTPGAGGAAATYSCNPNPAGGLFNTCPTAGGGATTEVLVLLDGTDAPVHVCGCCYTDYTAFLDANLPVVGAAPGDDSITMALCVNAHSDCYDSADKCQGTALADYYQRYCPLTCGICTRTTACVDLKSNCKYYLDYCEVEEYLPIMLYECSKTCGFCARKLTLDMTAPCVDTTATCASRYNLCNLPAFVTTMQNECMATCGFCVSNDTTVAASTQKTKSAPIVVPNTQTFITICKDERRDCPTLASLCNDPAHYSWLLQQCALTCNFCDEELIVEEVKPVTVVKPVIVQIHQTHSIHPHPTHQPHEPYQPHRPDPNDNYYKNHFYKNLLKISLKNRYPGNN
uniref:ShKT domain-containing protein n=1 Tax=Strongyloides venezuelensis TaxID=75913 RepID=A0A0K0G0J0_STRVS